MFHQLQIVFVGVRVRVRNFLLLIHFVGVRVRNFLIHLMNQVHQLNPLRLNFEELNPLLAEEEAEEEGEEKEKEKEKEEEKEEEH